MTKKMQLAVAAFAALLAPAVVACDSDSSPAAAGPALGNIVEVAEAAGSFQTLLAAAQSAGLAETLADGGPFTVFAPTDDAFAALPTGTVEALLEDPEALGAILLYHVVAGRVSATDVVGLSEAQTLNGASVSISVVGGQVRVGDANVTATDIEARNGIIHVIDAVLILPTD